MTKAILLILKQHLSKNRRFKSVRNGVKIIHIKNMSNALLVSAPIGIEPSSLLLTLIFSKVYEQESKADLTPFRFLTCHYRAQRNSDHCPAPGWALDPFI